MLTLQSPPPSQLPPPPLLQGKLHWNWNNDETAKKKRDLLPETLLSINWVLLRRAKVGGWRFLCTLPGPVPPRHSLEPGAVSCEQCQVGLERTGVTRMLAETKHGLVFISANSSWWMGMPKRWPIIFLRILKESHHHSDNVLPGSSFIQSATSFQCGKQKHMFSDGSPPEKCQNPLSCLLYAPEQIECFKP